MVGSSCICQPLLPRGSRWGHSGHCDVILGGAMIDLPENMKNVDKLLDDLMAPRFSYMMARGRLAACLRAGRQGDAMYRGAHATMLRSALKIDRIVAEYIAAEGVGPVAKEKKV